MSTDLIKTLQRDAKIPDDAEELFKVYISNMQETSVVITCETDIVEGELKGFTDDLVEMICSSVRETLWRLRGDKIA